MRLNALSSSKIKCFLQCPFKFYLEYHLSLDMGKKFASEQGSMVHEILEAFGKAKKNNTSADQSWMDYILKNYESPTGLWSLSKKACEREKQCNGCQYNSNGICFINKVSIEDFTGCPADEFNEAIWLVEKVINDNSPDNPLNRKIIDVENKFTIYVEDSGEKIPIVGIKDLVTEFDENTLEIFDYKTGNYIQSYKDCQKDPQPLIYHLAARDKYPKYKNIIVTFWYLKKGPVSLSFSSKDERGTVKALKYYWHTIRNDLCPKRRCDRQNGGINFDYKCKFMCNPEICVREWTKLQKQGGIVLDNNQTPYCPKKEEPANEAL